MKKKLIGLLVLIAALIFLSVGNDSSIIGITGKTTEQSPSEQTLDIPKEEGKILTYFCPDDNCMENLIYLINNSEKIHCALFDLDLEPLIKILKEKDAKVVVDNNNYAEELDFARQDNSNQLSHNKYCVFDDKIVWTGSFNPTFRGNYKNNNNVIVFFSQYLASNYENEFQELWNGIFSKGDNVKFSKVILNGNMIENYFCPEDKCEKNVLDVLDSATESVYFMTFSFTSDEIGEKLISLHNRGVEVKGVMEKSQKNKYVEFDTLSNAGIDVMWDNNKANMHHKVFIIDEKTVITGSYNPTGNGNKRNDENVVIVHNEDIASKYIEEFEKVRNPDAE